MSSSSSKSPDEFNKSSENESDQIENRKRKRRIKNAVASKKYRDKNKSLSPKKNNKDLAVEEVLPMNSLNIEPIISDLIESDQYSNFVQNDSSNDADNESFHIENVLEEKSI
jgi:hypothetical protein